ncbi:hypothetical protein ACEYYH_04480 [Microbacterium trichothecenolyticum]|uniref:hypothetical protein n=1 Tax=Microbacterium trichothecenolyticum TaxID=69370 RepID=UPI0035BE7B40
MVPFAVAVATVGVVLIPCAAITTDDEPSAMVPVPWFSVRDPWFRRTTVLAPTFVISDDVAPRVSFNSIVLLSAPLDSVIACACAPPTRFPRTRMYVLEFVTRMPD